MQTATVNYPKTSHNDQMSTDNTGALIDFMRAIATQRCQHAFSQVFKHFAPKIKAISIKKYGSEALAMEIVQDTMTNVWRKAHLFNETKGAVSTWIYTIMRNVTFDILRKSKSSQEISISDDLWPLDEYATEEKDTFQDHLQNQEILKRVNELPNKQQQVIKGVYFHELSQEQLAQQLNIPLGTVKSRLRLALEKLKQNMGDQHD
nr:sigma-70 family RNA polymerase sigma factor [Algibacillus agarilyticus]